MQTVKEKISLDDIKSHREGVIVKHRKRVDELERKRVGRLVEIKQSVKEDQVKLSEFKTKFNDQVIEEIEQNRIDREAAKLERL